MLLPEDDFSYKNSRYREGERLLKELGLESIDAVYLHILEMMSCLSIAQKSPEDSFDLAAVKRRIFLKTIKEITCQEEGELRAGKEGFNIPLCKVREAFPDRTKRIDGRMWLPMHFAMSIPDVSIADVDLLHSAQPGDIHRIVNDLDRLTPGHLAVMRTDPNIDLIRQLKFYDPNFASCRSADLSTPLHVAAKFSNSVEVVQELIEVQPLALAMVDNFERQPLFAVSANLNPNAIDILQVFIDSNTLTIEDLTLDDSVPFIRFLTSRAKMTDEMVLRLIEAFPDSIYLPDISGRCLIHLAPIWLSTQAFQVRNRCAYYSK